MRGRSGSEARIATAATRSNNLDAGPPSRCNPERSRHASKGMTAGKPSQEVRTLATATAAKTKLRPLGDKVIVTPTPREEMTKTGIVLPDTAKEKPQEGTVLAAGPGRKLDNGTVESMDVKEGDKVLYAKYAGTEFKLDGEELLIVSQKDILAVVEG